MVRINLIVAVDKKYGFSKNNTIPWRIREDSFFFTDVTKRTYSNKKNCVIMGKHTWKSLPNQYRGLSDRINIVISTTMTENELMNDNITKTEAYLVNNLNDAIELGKKVAGKIFIGGGEKYI